MNTDQLVEKLIKAINFKYREDKTAAGLTVAALKNGYYCSVVRYTAGFGKGKQVLCNVKGDTLEQALKGVATKFLSLSDIPKDPIQELNDLVKGS